MFTFLGIIGVILTIMVALPASLIAFATFIEQPIKTIVKLWATVIIAYKELWESITK